MHLRSGDVKPPPLHGTQKHAAGADLDDLRVGGLRLDEACVGSLAGNQLLQLARAHRCQLGELLRHARRAAGRAVGGGA